MFRKRKSFFKYKCFSMIFIIYLSSNFCKMSLAITFLFTKYFLSCGRQSVIISQAKWFIFYHSTSVIFSNLSFLCTVYKCCWNKTSMTSHCHMPKLLVLWNFSTSNITFINADLEAVEDFATPLVLVVVLKNLKMNLLT